MPQSTGMRLRSFLPYITAATAVSSAQAAMKTARPSGVPPSKLRVMPTATGASLRPMTMMTGPVTMGGR